MDALDSDGEAVLGALSGPAQDPPETASRPSATAEPLIPPTIEPPKGVSPRPERIRVTSAAVRIEPESGVPLEVLESPDETDQEVALRDARRVVAAAEADEVAAAQARARYRLEPMLSLAPDPLVASLLAAGERPIAIRRSVIVERRQPRPGMQGTTFVVGRLLVTSRRLLFVGRHDLAIDLKDIAEMLIGGERLLIVLRDGSGLAIGSSQPRLLRVEIAAARHLELENVGPD